MRYRLLFLLSSTATLSAFQADFSLAVDHFRSLPEGTWEGNFGAYTSLNLRAPIFCSLDVQIAGSYGVYDWQGRTSTPFNRSKVQQQGFITSALSREDICGFNAGLAYDWMLNKNFGLFAVNPFFDQVRAQLGYRFCCNHEFGLWGTWGIHTAHKTAQQVALKFRGIAQGNLFYCHYFENCSYAMIWGGIPYRKSLMFSSGRPGKFILGARFSAPLSCNLSLSGHASYMAGRGTGARNYAANVCFSLTYSFGDCDLKQTPYMNMADNSNFIVDTNLNL